MRALLQRVTRAEVTSEGKKTGAIGPGLLVLVCAEPDDTVEQGAFLTGKIAKMRIFADDNGLMNRSILDVGGQALVVSQFTLAATWRKGNRPGFSRAADSVLGKSLYDRFCETLRKEGVPVETGLFGTAMEVSLVNDGPVTIWMDTNDPNQGRL